MEVYFGLPMSSGKIHFFAYKLLASHHIMQICIPFIFNTCLAEPVFALFRKHYKSRLAGLEGAI